MHTLMAREREILIQQVYGVSCNQACLCSFPVNALSSSDQPRTAYLDCPTKLPGSKAMTTANTTTSVTDTGSTPETSRVPMSLLGIAHQQQQASPLQKIAPCVQVPPLLAPSSSPYPHCLNIVKSVPRIKSNISLDIKGFRGNSFAPPIILLNNASFAGGESCHAHNEVAHHS